MDNCCSLDAAILKGFEKKFLISETVFDYGGLHTCLVGGFLSN
jgi:hypothetical protein